MAEQGQQAAQGVTRMNIGGSLLAINFDRGADISKKMRAEVAQHGWEVPDAYAYPSIQCREPDLSCRPLTDTDVVLATVYAKALTEFFTQHEAELCDEGFIEAHACVEIDGFENKVQVEATAPYPQTTWDDLAVGDEHPALARSRDIIEAFLRHEKVQGRTQAWLDAAAQVCENLYDFKLYIADGDLEGWRVATVRDFMLRYVPRQAVIDAAVAAVLPEVTQAFFRWAQKVGHVTQRLGVAAVSCVERHQKRFLKEMNEPSNFSMAKVLLRGLSEAGIDLHDKDAVEAYMQGNAPQTK
jgi:hypothetical protein